MSDDISGHFDNIQKLLEHVSNEHCKSGEAFLEAYDIKNKITEIEMELDRLKNTIKRNKDYAG